MDNYSKIYVGLFHPIPINDISDGEVRHTILTPKVRRSLDRPLIRIHDTMDEGCEVHTHNRYSNYK